MLSASCCLSIGGRQDSPPQVPGRVLSGPNPPHLEAQPLTITAQAISHIVLCPVPHTVKTVHLPTTLAGPLHMLLFLLGTLPAWLIPPYPLGIRNTPPSLWPGSGIPAPCWLSSGNFAFTCFVCWGERELHLPLRPSCEQLEDRGGVFCTHFWSHLQAEPRAGHG